MSDFETVPVGTMAELERLREENTALAASLERIRECKRERDKCEGALALVWDDVLELAIDEASAVTLACRDARQRAGAVMAFAYEVWDEMLKRQKVIHVAPLTMAKKWIRRQAEESRDD